jgi:hypothetical protein
MNQNNNVNAYFESTTTQKTGNSLGQGVNGALTTSSGSYTTNSGGGGGYYGGNTQYSTCITNYFNCVSSSGSSYVSGHPGCINSSIIFKHPIITAGYGLMPSINVSSEIGHSGHGNIRISLLHIDPLSICHNDMKYLPLFIILFHIF